MIDGVRMAVLTNRFDGIVRAMMNTLFRTGRSNVLNTSRDFSCCIVTAGAELLVTAESIPVHVMRGPDLMAEVMKELHPDLRRGDAFLHNSPYHGNSHAGDHCVLVPVIDDEGVHRFTVVGKAHQADCGNALPTTYAATAHDVYEEGALIFPCVKAQSGYQDVADVIRMCQARIRVPKQWWGDYLALMGAVRIGERRLLELGAELGWDELHAYEREWLDYCERQTAEAIRRLPRARFTAMSAHDPFPGIPYGIPVTVTVAVDPDEARITVDLRDGVDCLPCGLNLSRACAESASMIGIFNSIDHTLRQNAGSFRRIDVLIRDGSTLGGLVHPYSASVATSNLADRLTSAVQRGMAELADGIGMAEVGAPIPPCCGVISGSDPRAGGAPFVNQLVLPALTAGAGSPNADGWLTATHCGSAGAMFRDSIELDELRYPMRVVEQRIIPDSEGAGRTRGAPAGYAEFGPVGTELDVMWASDGNVNPALGARGGLAGGLSDQYRRRVDGTLERLPACGMARLGPGETIVSISTGGGGYGDPFERAVERVRKDVAEGWVTRERAREVYGVVIDADGVLDDQATHRQRGG